MEFADGVSTSAPTTVHRFSTFQLIPAHELLLDGDKSVRIGSRALRILTVLVERAGQLVGKNELIELVWPDTFVQEGNLKVHIAALRRVLGDSNGHLIANIPGRGYRFIADVSRSELSAQQPAAATQRSGYVPALLTKVIGRGEAVEAIANLLAEYRFATITGAGGIGKTTVAIAVADQLANERENQASFIELSAVPDPALLPSIIASVLRTRLVSGDPIDQIVELIGTNQTLLVLDNCEHVIQRAAEVAETLLSRVPSLKILATSREPLRARGEQVYRLAPLTVPPEDIALDAEGALGYSAVALFVERSRSGAASIPFNDIDVAPVVEICRRLDGLPLALELAAARSQNFGFAHLASRLEDRLSILTKGRRTAVPRQRTLRATLDWSFELLTPQEQVLFARLGIFAGAFTLEIVSAVCPVAENEHHLLDGLSSLADKSMLSVDTSSDLVRYQLLETTKAYALERLRASGEFDVISERRTRALHDMFATARRLWTLQNARAWLQSYRHWIGDVRAGLEWAFVHDRDIELGASLLLEASQLWIDLGFMLEFFEHADRALNALARCDDHEKEIEMRLSSAVGHAIYEMGMRPDLKPTMLRSFDRALRLAEELGDARKEVRALVSQCIGNVATGEYADVLPLAQRFREIGTELTDVNVELLYNKSCGVASMFMGRLREAENFVEAALADPDIKTRANSHEAFDFDPLIFTLNIRARLLWMRGYPDQAMAVVREIVDEALSLGHLPSFLNAFQVSVSLIPIWYGDTVFQANELERFVTYGEEHNLDYRKLWRTIIRLGADCRAQDWNFVQARQAMADLNTIFNNYAHELFSTLHPGFTAPHMLGRVREGKSGWCAAEVIRAVGEERLDGGDFSGAKEALDEALDLARSQGARAWELRSAMSLCRLDRLSGSAGSGRDLLASVYETYTEGFASIDLRAASALLHQPAS